MQIQREEHGRNGAFFIDENGEWIAELAYIKSGDGQITIDHTEVDEKLRGQGVGEELVKAAVDFARENGLKIKLICPYARKVFEKNPDYSDVLV
ncbi:MAG TPA: GNAT family N-acetyltransferase [Pyrinomonadaceae bacterium]|nr:GNAT family N-acetyltransferase [Pyrinomonadaceae bacterium]